MPLSLVERFRAFAHSDRLPPTQTSEAFEIALLVAQCVDAQCSPDATRAALATLVSELDGARTPWENLRSLGFQGNRENYEAIENSAIHRVLERRTGIPITLAVVLMEAAAAQGLEASGINHPGHFLVRIENTLIDPFAMEPVNGASADALRLPPVTAVELGLRMLNNLKYGYVRDRVWHQALDIVNLQLALVPEHAQLLFETGEYWAELGGMGAARQAYERALAQLEVQTPDAEPATVQQLRAKIDKRLRRLANSDSETMH